MNKFTAILNTKMILKLHATLLMVLVLTLQTKGTSANSVCSLDTMRRLAYEACEHIFNLRERRSIHSNMIDGGNDSMGMIKIKRRSYPAGGYLKVSHHHAMHLKSMRIDPRYETHGNKYQHFVREKRQNSAENAVKYCCRMQCGPDMYCHP